jgi:hypothetical protein
VTDSKERLFSGRVSRLALRLKLPENFRFAVERDQEFLNREGLGRVYVQVICWRRDVVTGEMGEGKSGKVFLSRHMTDTEVFHALFSAYRGYFEHEARETFEVDGVRIFGPHIDVTALLEVAERVDVRGPS